MNKMISVIIPTYNRCKLLIRSVRSVLKQSYKNIEVIVIDDCSTDKTEEYIKKIKDNRLKYIKLRKNHGACYARNIGICKAKGEFIAFQDSDDIFYKDKLEIQLKNMLKNKSDIDLCKLKVIVNKNIWNFPNDEQDKKIIRGNILNELCKGNIISTQSILVKREVLADIKFDENLPRFQDYDLVLRIALKYNISYTNDALAEVYRQNDSISNSDEKLKNACVEMLKKDYKLSKKQKNVLNNTLIYWMTKKELDTIYELRNENDRLSSDCDNLLRINNDLKNKYDNLNNLYNEIINNRYYKYLIKIKRIIKK